MLPRPFTPTWPSAGARRWGVVLALAAGWGAGEARASPASTPSSTPTTPEAAPPVPVEGERVASPATARPAREGPLLLMVPAELAGSRRQAIVRAIRAHTVDLGAPVEVVEVEGWPPDLLGRVRVAMARAEDRAARGVFWVEGEAGEDLLVYLIEPDGLKALVRRIPRDGASDAALLESVGVIVRASGEALLAGRSIGMEEVEVPRQPEPEPEPEPRPPSRPAPSPAPTPGPAPPKRSFRMFAPEVGYVGANVGDTLPWQSGLTVGLGVRPVQRLTLRLGYDAMLPAQVRTSAVDLQVQRHGVRLTAAVRGTPRPWLGLEAGAWLLTDVWVRRARDQELAGSGASTRVVPALGPQLRLAMRPFADLWIFLGAGLDIPLLDVDYVVEIRDGSELRREVVLNTHSVRARVTAGLLYTLF